MPSDFTGTIEKIGTIQGTGTIGIGLLQRVSVAPSNFTGTIESGGTIRGTGTAENRVSIESSSHAKRFHRRYTKRWHYSGHRHYWA